MKTYAENNTKNTKKPFLDYIYDKDGTVLGISVGSLFSISATESKGKLNFGSALDSNKGRVLSVDQWRYILPLKMEINEMLLNIGGDKLCGCYWTSNDCEKEGYAMIVSSSGFFKQTATTEKHKVRTFLM